MMQLPTAFCDRMKELLGSRFDDFLSSYDKPASAGLRYNPLKTTKEAFLARMREETDFGLEEIPWCGSGFYFDGSRRPGLSPYHDIGLFYIQEPSAMIPVEVLDPQPGERVLDLCAAPGGKTTQIAGKMKGEGVLVSNEISYERAKVLSQNVERMGISNCIVTCNTPDELTDVFEGFFDRILIDAPCSGEGMFKTKENAIPEWSAAHVELCAYRAQEIIRAAVPMLKSGGVLVYSTCTFAREENEEMVELILREYPFMELDGTDVNGIGRLISPGLDGACGTYRVFPHLQRGEGHFIARLRHTGTAPAGSDRMGREKEIPRKGAAAMPRTLLRAFEEEVSLPEQAGFLVQKKEVLYRTPLVLPEKTGLHILRYGLEVGSIKKDRIEPSHSLALALDCEGVGATVETEELELFLRGDTIRCDEKQKGWVLVTHGGLALGWGKASGGTVKNHYPKGLRRR